jgi:L-fuconolactonase
MRIDSHQHFWLYDPEQYGWMQPEWPIRRNYLPTDLAPELQACQLDACVAVQARQSLAESRWLLELADQHSLIAGVVGWVDLRSPEVEQQLDEFAAHPKFVGVRHVVQDEPDDWFLLGIEFQRGIAQLAARRLTYDLLLYPRQLPAAIALVERFPEQRFVLDHIAKPEIRQQRYSPWREDIRRLAAHPHVFCKLSGMITEASWNEWKPADFERYLADVVEAFGPDRLMFGSDWPVALLAGTYRQAYDLVANYVARLGAVAVDQIMGRTACSFYGLAAD